MNVLTIEIFTLVAILLFKTPDSATIPYSVNTDGRYFLPFVAFFKVPNWNLKSSYSFLDNLNIKSLGVISDNASSSSFEELLKNYS